MKDIHKLSGSLWKFTSRTYIYLEVLNAVLIFDIGILNNIYLFFL